MDIHIEKRHLYILVSLIVLSTGILFVRGSSSNFGHSGDDITVTVDGVEKDLNTALNEVSGFSECATARITEAVALGTDTAKLIDYSAANAPLLASVIKPAVFKNAGTNYVPSNIGGQYFGSSCASGWQMMACSHAADTGDSDVILIENGCYADEGDGSKLGNFVDMKCCKL